MSYPCTSTCILYNSTLKVDGWWQAVTNNSSQCKLTSKTGSSALGHRYTECRTSTKYNVCVDTVKTMQSYRRKTGYIYHMRTCLCPLSLVSSHRANEKSRLSENAFCWRLEDERARFQRWNQPPCEVTTTANASLLLSLPRWNQFVLNY